MKSVILKRTAYCVSLARIVGSGRRAEEGGAKCLLEIAGVTGVGGLLKMVGATADSKLDMMMADLLDCVPAATAGPDTTL